MSNATRVVLVTGGTGALGRAVVARFAQDGDAVHVPWVADKEKTEVEQAFGAMKNVRLHRCDVSVQQDVAALFRAIEASDGPVDVLASLVGGFTSAAIEDTSVETWERMFRLNAATTFLSCRAAVPGMKSKKRGRIITVSSAPAVNHGGASISAYAAAKAAVLNFSESLAKELVGWNITVNSIVPSVIDTPANRKANPGADTSTWLKPEDIADVVAFLASDRAAIISGTAVTLTKG